MKKFICKACNYETSIKCNYRKHLFSFKHNKNLKNIFCPLCKKNFPSREKQKKHLKKRYPCDLYLEHKDPIEVLNTNIILHLEQMNYIDRNIFLHKQILSHSLYSEFCMERLYKIIIENTNIYNTKLLLITNSFIEAFIDTNDNNHQILFIPLTSSNILIKTGILHNLFTLLDLSIINNIINILNLEIEPFNDSDFQNFSYEIKKSYFLKREDVINKFIY